MQFETENGKLTSISGVKTSLLRVYQPMETVLRKTCETPGVTNKKGVRSDE